MAIKRMDEEQQGIYIIPYWFNNSDKISSSDLNKKRWLKPGESINESLT